MWLARILLSAEDDHGVQARHGKLFVQCDWRLCGAVDLLNSLVVFRSGDPTRKGYAVLWHQDCEVAVLRDWSACELLQQREKPKVQQVMNCLLKICLSDEERLVLPRIVANAKWNCGGDVDHNRLMLALAVWVLLLL